MTLPAARLRLARELIAIGRRTDAAAIIAEVLAAEPGSAEALCTLAYYHHHAGEPTAMLDAADRAAAAQPDSAWAHRLRALALLGTGRIEPALLAAAEAIALAPVAAAGHQLLAHALCRAGRPLDGYRSALRAVELAPDDPDSYATLAHALTAAGERAAARAAIRAALRLSPDATGPRRTLAEAHTRGWRYPAAARTYQALLRTHPTDRDLPAAFESALDWLQAAWSGLAAAVAVVALVLYVAGVPPLPRAPVAAALIGVWAAGYRWAHRGLGSAWWRYVRSPEPGGRATRTGRRRREPRATVLALLVPLAVAALFGFAPGALPFRLLLLVLLFFAVALVMPVGFAGIQVALAMRDRRRRREFRRALATPIWSPGSSVPRPPPAGRPPHDTPAPPAR